MRSTNENTNHLVNSTGAAPSYTYTADWTWLSAAPDQALRIYHAVRAFVFDKDDDWTITLTDGEIATLTHRSEDSVKRARKQCYQHGLLTEVGIARKSVGGHGKHQVRTERTIRVEHEPPTGYHGAVNCYRELKRIRETAGHSEGADVPTQSDQAKQHDPGTDSLDKQAPSPGEIPITAGHSEGANLPAAQADLPVTQANLLPVTHSDLHKHAPQVPSPSAFPTNHRALATDTPPTSAELGWMDAPEKTHHASSSAESPCDAPDHHLMDKAAFDTVSTPHGDAGPTSGPGGELLRSLAAADGTTLSAAAVTEHAGQVARYLDTGHTEQAIRTHLTSGARGAGFIRAKLRHLADGSEALPALASAHSSRPAWCGGCEQQTRMRERADGRMQRCSTCHPACAADAQAAA